MNILLCPLPHLGKLVIALTVELQFPLICIPLVSPLVQNILGLLGFHVLQRILHSMFGLRIVI